jgi:hypothetical protein
MRLDDQVRDRLLDRIDHDTAELTARTVLTTHRRADVIHLVIGIALRGRQA